MRALRLDVGLPSTRDFVGNGSENDTPGAEEEDTKPGTTEVVLTEENAGEVLDLINKLNR